MGARARRPGPMTPEMRLAWLLGILDHSRRVVEQHARLGHADQRLMWLFQDRRPRTLREVSEDLSLEQSTVNRQVNAALAAGLLTRRREPGQAAHVVAATEDGQARFERDRALHLGIFRQALAGLDPAARATLLEDLERVVSAYGDVVAGRPWEQEAGGDLSG
ncbi:MarR family winged helix-turn-helix transcriptional regulator [Phycicoccus endophyticus]|uniref:MarR family winged helix-turn-helix transcriptional regulator n=1 Tax=Phycicoccus endophyticus TaxID=1690220 RepID=UPI00197BBEC1|nr:MarR family winged helix-turn-helix transcriptional regulator [Phycicoccus endophyticus]GGL37037.1 hypothetical protein GCM10012283_19520 [Phycicoccus endophyticus]